MTAALQRVKLENPGEELILRIVSVEAEDIGGYPYWLITDGEKELAIAQKTLAGQIDRVGVATAPEMVGKTVKFSRSVKVNTHGKPYWNLDLVANFAPKTSPKPPAPKNGVSYGHPGFLEGAEQQEAAELQKRIGFDISKIQTDLSLYQSITEWYLATMVPVLTKADVGCSPESVNAAVATIFIQAKK